MKNSIFELSYDRKFVYFSLKLFFLCLLHGCSHVRYFQDNLDFHQQNLNLTNKAEKYLDQAAHSSANSTKNDLTLAGIKFLIQANHTSRAKDILSQLNDSTLNYTQEATAKILWAEIRLSENNYAAAKNLIQIISNNYPNLDHATATQFYETKIKFLHQSGEPLEAIQERIYLEKLLLTQAELNKNRKAIWAELQQLTPSVLESARHNNFSYIMQGWLNIAYITTKYDADPSELTRGIAAWQYNFPHHPANYILKLRENDPIIDPKQPDVKIIAPPQLHKIALLLPLTGTYKLSGNAIKNGFLAASYAKKNEISPPEIIIFDTNQESIRHIYKMIQEDNIDLIVGPLLKEDIEKMARLNKLYIPTIALNTVENITNDAILFFGLPPEAESQAIVEQARTNKYKNALLILETNELNQRISRSIVNNWNLIGNNIVSIINLDKNSDINSILKVALGIEDSTKRAKSLASLGLKFNFDPRRRQDLDCIFLLTNATYARQIKPLLNFYYASKVPIYASSAINSGMNNPSLNRDLDRIQFCDLPWMLDPTIANSNIYQLSKKLWKENFIRSPRLYALGIDAYKIANHLQVLMHMPEVGISGMTGILKLMKNNINRKLMWGTFEKGVPKPLPSNFNN